LTGPALQYKAVKRPVSGVLLLDKPAGISSNSALQKAKRLYQAAKAGHTGNLDPFATGLLPVCLGEATKFSQFLLDADKTYQGWVRLGQTTTTGDPEGEVLSRSPVDVGLAQVEQVLSRFVGRISQVPPMYSALKRDGKPLYEYARQGVEVEREAREVTIYDLRLDRFAGEEVVITVRCSKGTYIRTLAEDIGKALGCGAYLEALRRTAIGGFAIGDAKTLEQLDGVSLEERDAWLLPADSLLQGFPQVELDADSAFYLGRGQEVWLPRTAVDGVVRLYDDKRRFLGIGEVTGEGKIAPRRLVVFPSV
jgi:tRNA pseudouridine 55 synthase